MIDATAPPVADDANLRELAVLLHDLAHAFPCDRPGPLQPAALPTAGWEALRAVVATPGVTVARLAVTLDKQASNISGMVRELITRGLVTRHQNETDRRFAYLYPTDAAVRDTDLLEASWGKHLRAALAAAPSEDATHLLTAIPTLRALATALRSSAKPPR